MRCAARMSGILRGETSTSYRVTSLIKTVVEEAWALAFRAAGYLWRPRAKSWSSPGGLRVLVVAPHPDDEVAGCGGAILLHRAKSDQVCVVYVTDGRRSRAGGLGADEMARRRRAEAAASARALDVSHVEWLGLPESDWCEHELNAALTAVLDRYSPDMVYAPSRIDFHPEHYRVARCLAAVLQARRAAAVPANPILRVYQVQVPLTPVLTNLVAATASVEAGSLAALQVYVTQAGSLLRCLRMKRYAARWYGIAGQAEEFWELTAAQYGALHGQPPTRSLVRTFRSLRSFALTDPLAYGRGLLERRRLARVARAG